MECSYVLLICLFFPAIAQGNIIKARNKAKTNAIDFGDKIVSGTSETETTNYSNITGSMKLHSKSEVINALGDDRGWVGEQITKEPLTLGGNSQETKELFTNAIEKIQHVSSKAKKQFRGALAAAFAVDNEDARLNVTQLVQKYKYPIEEHTVKTEDGYVLTLVRIVKTAQHWWNKKPPVVFLMHGLLDSADDWVLMGPQKSLAYILYDAGFDVWMGNARGNKYSRKHVNMHPAQPEFWNFSWDEIGRFDLPAMIDYVLLATNQKNLFYVGHSQGTTSFFVMASTRPEYNTKIIMMFALAPVAWSGNLVSPFVRLLSPGSNVLEKVLDSVGVNEFLPDNKILQAAGGFICQNKAISDAVCSNAAFIIFGFNLAQLNATMLPVILGHLPAGSSTKQLLHYGQGVTTKYFRRYDFGKEANHELYGSPIPPAYDVAAVTAPVALYYSENDWLSHPIDVKILRDNLPNVADFYLVPDKQFNHMDYMWALNAPEVIYRRIIADMQQHI